MHPLSLKRHDVVVGVLRGVRRVRPGSAAAFHASPPLEQLLPGR